MSRKSAVTNFEICAGIPLDDLIKPKTRINLLGLDNSKYGPVLCRKKLRNN
jgi:hypothetical protein